MKGRLTDLQAAQLPLLLHNCFMEIQMRADEPRAIGDLTHAAHNLPFLAASDHFSIDEITFLFEEFHRKHGYKVYDFPQCIKGMMNGEDLREDRFIFPRSQPNFGAQLTEQSQ